LGGNPQTYLTIWKTANDGDVIEIKPLHRAGMGDRARVCCFGTKAEPGYGYKSAATV